MKLTKLTKLKQYLNNTITSKVDIQDPNHPPFKYICKQTGELECTLADAIKTTISTFIFGRTILTWNYKKEGF